jgi:hypothetical protein
MGVTSDRNDPGLKDIGPDGMQRTYLVLSEEERAKGFVRPVRTKYIHLGHVNLDGSFSPCGAVTTMGKAIAETYAREPRFYGGTMCVRCHAHFPVGADGEFDWAEPRKDTPLGQGDKVGT